MRLAPDSTRLLLCGPTRGNFRRTETNTPQIFFFAD